MAQEKMDMIARDPAELEVRLRRAYEQYEKAASDYTTEINGARREGKLEAAKNFLGMGLSPEQVAKGTGLPLDVITRL